VARIERLINLVAALLETRRPLSAEEIRTRIAGYGQESKEAFRRSFERDKQALREMGVPVETRSLEPYGEEGEGYLIPKDRYYLPDLDLEPDELAALRIAVDTLLNPGEGAGTGLLKLSMGTEGPGLGAPRPIAGANVAVEDPHLSSLYEALTARTPVAFRYEDARGRVSQRRVEPWGLVHRAGHWYLVGRDGASGERRTFKLVRISELTFSDGSYEIPADADVSGAVGGEAWEFGGSEVGRATVRFAPEARWWAEQNLSHLPAAEAPSGALDVDMPVGNDAALLGWVIGWGGSVVIVSPPELRRALVDHVAPWRPRVAESTR
jgi:predicted DNA-binding transcriptional regulator YafY